MISLTDSGWCSTDLGGPNAPNEPKSALPSVVIGSFADDKISGRCFTVPLYSEIHLEEAVKFAQSNVKSPY